MKVTESQKENLVSAETSANKNTIIINNKVRWFIFVCIALTNFMTNLDGGIVPAAGKTMYKDDLGQEERGFGLYGSIDYAGRIVGSIIFTFIINLVNRKWIMVITLMVKGAFMILPSLGRKSYFYNLLIRFVTGLCQVYYTIYLPIWCDQYGKPKLKSMMVTIIQVALPLGVVLGYGLQLLVIHDWIYSFIVEGIILLGCGVLFIFLPDIYFSKNLALKKGSDNEAEEKSIEERAKEQGSQKSNLLKNFFVIICEKVFLFTGISYSIVYFSEAVIQYWITDYMTTVIGITDENTLMIIFGTLCITSPIAGVVLGGIIGSLVGGYNTKKAVVCCIFLCALSAVFGIVIPFVSSTIGFTILMWLFFFFLTSLSPLETGIIISSLSEDLKGDGFSIMNFILNILGNMPSTFVYGALNESMKFSQPRMPMFITMLYNFVGLVCIIFATIFRLRKPDELPPKDVKNLPETQK